MKPIACEICHWIGKHLPLDPERSEIDLIGFMNDSAEDSVEPKWMCQNCYEAFQALNPEATPIMIKYAP